MASPAAAASDAPMDLEPVLMEPLVGCHVRICNLKARADLNGRIGKVLEYFPEKQRFGVELLLDDDDGSGDSTGNKKKEKKKALSLGLICVEPVVVEGHGNDNYNNDDDDADFAKLFGALDLSQDERNAPRLAIGSPLTIPFGRSLILIDMISIFMERCRVEVLEVVVVVDDSKRKRRYRYTCVCSMPGRGWSFSYPVFGL